MRAHLTRRWFVQAAAGAAGAAVLAACGAEGATVAPTAARPATTQIPGGTGGQTPAAVATTAATAAPAATTSSAATTAPTTSSAATTAPTTMTMTTAGMTPLNPPNPNAKGAVRYWQATYDDPTLPSAKFHAQWTESVKTTLPNVQLKEEQYAYNDMLDKLRVALKAGQGPDMSVIPILWGSEFAYAGQLEEIKLADFGYKPEQFWPGALKSVTVNGKLYGIPSRNETHAFIWNKEIFKNAGLDPEKPPQTWEDVKNFSKQIKDKTGKAGYGLVAKLNAGDIPFRYMPLTWAHGGASLDETADMPTYIKSQFDSEANIAALQWVYDVYVRDGSAPMSAITNTGVENQNLLLSGEIAMMSGHPSTYALFKTKAPDVAEKLGYTLMPKGPVRRAVTFGGWNVVIFKGAKDMDAVKAVVKDFTSPIWSLRHAYEGSNPGNRDGFNLPEQQTRFNEIKYLNITTEMLQYGISFPTVPEASDIMNLIVPQMMQDVMTKAKTPQQAGQDAAKKVNDMLAKRR